MSTNGMASVAEIRALIRAGRSLLLAGEESLLAQLPEGNWIGGTAANFMTEAGGQADLSQIFYTDLTDDAAHIDIKRLCAADLPTIGAHYPENGFAVIIVPGLSPIHARFAGEVQTYAGIFNSPLIGWVSGVAVAEIGKRAPKVFAGTQIASADCAAVMYVGLPAGKMGKLDIINLFKIGHGPVIEFAADGFSTEGECLIGEKPATLATYMTAENLDVRLPLVADYNGAMINVSVKSVQADLGKVHFYAPVFRGIQYRFADPVADYTASFAEQASKLAPGAVVFSCNCILNYLYAGLEGKKTGGLVGPITFGEIAYLLLNQTLVYLSIESGA